MKKIVTDSSNFKDFIQRDACYIDKTKQIVEFFELSNKIILMPRPRRFGKTLFLSTIYYLFSNLEKDETLFKETAIYGGEFFKEHFGKYPVISITFKDVKELNFESMLVKVQDEILVVAEKLLKDIDLDNVKCEKRYINCLKNILSYTATQKDYEKSLKALTIVLTSFYNTPCIVLIDEYDTPIIQSYLKGYYEEAITFLKSLLGSALKGNDLNIQKALITGILRISKESMFSDMNNLKIYTILDKPLSTACGFTKDETVELLDYYGIKGELKEEALTWYNSYTFGEYIVTNPWSILNFCESKEFEAYWANTASNDFIYDLVQKSRDFQANLEKLLKNEPIDIAVDKNITLRDKELTKKDNLFSLLFFSGYLKCKEKYIQKDDDGTKQLHCKMLPANIECKMIFKNIISKYVRESFENQNIEDILNSLISGNIKLFEKLFSYLLRDTASYFDTKNENSYHMFLLGILVNLSNEYEIISNIEAGYGRVDIVLLPKKDKEKLAIVMELKEIDEFEEETKEKALDKAVKQIKEQEYISLAKKEDITIF